jgi:hypothetical protein
MTARTANSIAPTPGRVVPAHAFDNDSVCRHCGFDGAEWWHLERMKPKQDREPEPACSYEGEEDDFDDSDYDDYCNCPVIHDDTELGGICASCGKLVD